MNISINVISKVATLVTPINIVCGNSDYVITFSFDEEWANETVKTARFVYRKDGKTKYKEVVFHGDEVKAPVLSDITMVAVGVYAGDLRTTTPAIIGCEKSILCDIGKHEDPEEDIYNQLIKLINSGGFGGGGSGGGSTATIGYVTLLGTKWVGNASPYSQVVQIEGVTENSQVDLTPDVQQLSVFYEKDLTFVTENEDGIVTVYAIGQKPENDYIIQVTITEVRV